MLRRHMNPRMVSALAVALAVGVAIEARGDDAPTSVTIWRSPAVQNPYYGGYGAYGGTTYGAYDSNAFITDRRKVDIPASGELSFDGVSARIEPVTVQFRSISDPNGTSVLEQRFVRGLSSPDELLARHIGKQVTVVTEKGEVTGTLRAVDAEALVVEVGSGQNKAVEVLRRGDFVRDIKLPGATLASDRPSLVWKLKTGKSGTQQIEVSYRTGGLSWSPDYSAILDEAKNTVDFSAMATIQNQTGIDFDDVDLTLTTGALNQSNQAVANPYGYGYGGYGTAAPPRPPTPTTSYDVPRRVKLGKGESVQVELMPARAAAKTSKVVLFEAVPDQSANYQGYPQQDCYAFVPAQSTHAQVALEVQVGKEMPEGRVRLFRRKAGGALEVASEDTLRVNSESGLARIGLAPADSEITGDRKQVDCRYDDRTRTLHEKVEVKVENKGKTATDVIVREYMYRWMSWKIEAEDEKGSKAAPQTQEYRIKVPANGKKSFTYSVIYSW
jgi:hypothetical protein